MLIFWYAVIGVGVGMLSGLLGLGGGLVVVPALATLYAWQQFPADSLMHLAIGTSLATILITSLMTTWSQQKHGSVVWSILKWFIPGMITGSFLGVALGKQFSDQGLRWAFAAFCVLMSIHILRSSKKAPKQPRQHSTSLFLTLAIIAGMCAGILGVGGGMILIPMFLWVGLSMTQASACSAACAIPTALSGTITAMIVGWHTPGLPPHSLGFVYWPAALGIGVFSVLTAPVGVYLSHRLPVWVIKRIFGGILLIVAWQMIPWKIL